MYYWLEKEKGGKKQEILSVYVQTNQISFQDFSKQLILPAYNIRIVYLDCNIKRKFVLGVSLIGEAETFRLSPIMKCFFNLANCWFSTQGWSPESIVLYIII